MARHEVEVRWLGRRWRVALRGNGGRLRAAADVRGYGAARRLRDAWRRDLDAGASADQLRLPADVAGTLRSDLLDPEGFGEVGPDELAG